jgi:hypothetical protein
MSRHSFKDFKIEISVFIIFFNWIKDENGIERGGHP